MQEIHINYATEELVMMYQSSHSESYLQEIISRNNGLLRIWVQNYSNIPFYDSEDLLEEGYIALWQAVEGFDLARGYTFSSCLKGYLKQHFNRLYNDATRKKRYTGSEPTSWEELEEIHKESSMQYDFLSDMDVREFINSLDGKVQYIAIKLLEGYSKVDISRALGIAPASVTYHFKRLERLAIEYFSVKGSRRLSEAF